MRIWLCWSILLVLCPVICNSVLAFISFMGGTWRAATGESLRSSLLFPEHASIPGIHVASRSLIIAFKISYCQFPCPTSSFSGFYFCLLLIGLKFSLFFYTFNQWYWEDVSTLTKLWDSWNKGRILSWSCREPTEKSKHETTSLWE